MHATALGADIYSVLYVRTYVRICTYRTCTKGSSNISSFGKEQSLERSADLGRCMRFRFGG